MAVEVEHEHRSVQFIPNQDFDAWFNREPRCSICNNRGYVLHWHENGEQSTGPCPNGCDAVKRSGEIVPGRRVADR